MEVTSTRTTKALLGTVLMDCIDRLAYRAYKAERRPVFICRLLLQRSYDMLQLRWPWRHEKLQATKVSTQHPRRAYQQPPPGATRPPQPHGGRLVRPAAAYGTEKDERARSAAAQRGRAVGL